MECSDVERLHSVGQTPSEHCIHVNTTGRKGRGSLSGVEGHCVGLRVTVRGRGSWCGVKGHCEGLGVLKVMVGVKVIVRGKGH